MNRRRLLATIGAVVSGCERAPVASPALTLGAVLGGNDVDGFERATALRRFQFPADHGAHPTFRNEWWYLTGNLRAADGRRFGYQITFFNVGLPRGSSAPPASASAWRSERLWMGHIALTDVATGAHHAFERFTRENPGLAGAQAEPLRIWLEDWQLSGGEQAEFPWQLRASADDFAFDFTLSSAKPPVLQGEQGLSRKNATAGNASYYYSLTRLGTTGELRLGGERVAVKGNSWLDREWSTSVLADDQVGWDWFSLQFDDGQELMYYQLRRADGSADPFSHGNWTAVDAVQTPITPAEIQLEPLRAWQAPSGVRYDVAWRLRLRGASYRVEALVDAQYMALSIPYWEGAVQIVDEQRGAIVGHGYLEMVRP